MEAEYIVAIPYEEMRSFVWIHGWRPLKFKEKGKTVLAWEFKKSKRFAQDLETAYHYTKYQQEVLNK